MIGFDVDMKLPSWVIGIVVFGFVVALYASFFGWLFSEWMSNPYYSHGVLVVLVCAAVVFLQRKSVCDKALWSSDERGLYVIGAGLLLYVVGFVLLFRFVVGLSFVLVCCGLILLFCGNKVFSKIWFSAVFLLAAIPLPLEYLVSVAVVLQGFAVDFSVFFLQLLGFSVAVSGAVICVSDLCFEVGLACSGMYSLMSLVSLGCVWAFFVSAVWWKKAVIVGSSVVFAVFANGIRVVSIVLVGLWFGQDVAISFFHDLSSIVVFVVALLCLIGFSYALGARKISELD